MEIARDEWGLNDQLARSAAAAEEARRSKARSLRSESEAEGPEPSEKMVDELADDGEDELEEGELEEGELEEQELPPMLQEDPIPDEREFPLPSPCPITDNACVLLALASDPVPPTPAAPPRPVEVVVEIVSPSFLSSSTKLILPMMS